MALVNHKKLKIDDDDLEKENKSSDLSKKSLHDLSQVRFLNIYFDRVVIQVNITRFGFTDLVSLKSLYIPTREIIIKSDTIE